jgi:ubiquinone/menaquinone biosynthesis C-methylase UbiE
MVEVSRSLRSVDEEIRAYYEAGLERDRLQHGYSRIEFARTRDLLDRHLPAPPARILDVGGGPGAYSLWLAEAGYDVRLVDATPLHVEQALETAAGRFEAVVGDARELGEEDGSFDAVLLLGPLYHLLEAADRLAALREAARVLRPGGVLAAAAISRFASLLDGLVRDLLDADGWALVERDLADGKHLPPKGNVLFTTAYFHLPDELRGELEEAGFTVEGLFGVEGPGWLRTESLDDERVLADAVRVARAVEDEPSIVGASAHFLAIGRR